MSKWIAFADQAPPTAAALDDPSVVTTNRVLVTNNLNAKDRMGRMSHVWFAAPIRGKDGWCTFDEADRKIIGLTHWMDPFNSSILGLT